MLVFCSATRKLTRSAVLRRPRISKISSTVAARGPATARPAGTSSAAPSALGKGDRALRHVAAVGPQQVREPCAVPIGPSPVTARYPPPPPPPPPPGGRPCFVPEGRAPPRQSARKLASTFFMRPVNSASL